MNERKQIFIFSKSLQTVFIIFLSLFTCVFVFAQVAPLNGLYKGTAEAAPYGKVPVTAEIFVSENNFTGKVITPLGDLNIVKGKKNGNDLMLVLDLSGADLIYQATVAPDGTIKGSLASPNLKGTLELKRIGDVTDNSVVYRQSKEKWREDLQFLARELATKHKNAFHSVSKEKFERAVAEFDSKIPTLDDEQIMVEMSRIAAMIGDGHTSLAWNWEYPRLPVRFFWFGNELRIIKNAREYPRLNGAKVIKINGAKIGDLFDRSQPFISQGESRQFVFDSSQYLFRFPAFLKTVGNKNAASGSAVIEAVDLKGKTFSQTVKAVSADAKIEWITPYKKVPLYLQNEDEPLSFDYLADKNAVYVNFRSYPRRAEFAEFSKKLFAFIDENKVQKLIIDLRANGGGNFNTGRDFLLKPIKERKNLLERGKIFVIIGRKTFSAAMVNADDFKKQADAILIGEPTGARPNNYGEVRASQLPNSRLPIRYSTDYYKFSETDVPALAPDILIEPDWKPFLSGEDKVLSAALNYWRKS